MRNLYTCKQSPCIVCNNTHTVKDICSYCKNRAKHYKVTNRKKRKKAIDRILQKGFTVKKKQYAETWKEDTYTIECVNGHKKKVKHLDLFKCKRFNCKKCATLVDRAIAEVENVLREQELSQLSSYVNTLTSIQLKCTICSNKFSYTPPAIRANKRKFCFYCRNGIDLKERNRLKNLTFKQIPWSGIIYKATSPVGEIYIGQTMRNIKVRITSHKKAYKDKNSLAYYSKLFRSFRKYGFKNFTWEILHYNVPWDKLDILEKQEILNHSSFTDGLNG